MPNVVTRLRGCRYLIVVALGACGTPDPPPLDPAVHREDVEAWRAYRYDLLHREGWLRLTGLFWLEEGENTIGAATDSHVRLQGVNLPDRVGVLTVRGGAVELQAAPGVDVRHAGTPVRRMILQTDANPDGDTTVLSVGSLAWHVIERQGRLAVRVQDTLAPAHVGFEGIPSFPLDARWRRVARFDRYDPPKPIMVPSTLGGANERASPGAVVFDVDGATYRLDVLGAPGDSAFWIQFGDETNGRETYGGGRYIWVDAPAAGDALVIDFNESYNPPCVFSPYATCPLPPRQNRLRLRIDAGELAWTRKGGP